MSDFTVLSADAAIFQQRMASADRTLADARSNVGQARDADTDLAKASEQFEALLLNFMIREMRATVPDSTLFPPSMAEEIFRGMLDERIAGEMAQNGGIGISRMIFNQLKGEK